MKNNSQKSCNLKEYCTPTIPPQIDRYTTHDLPVACCCLLYTSPTGFNFCVEIASLSPIPLDLLAAIIDGGGGGGGGTGAGAGGGGGGGGAAALTTDPLT